MDAAARWRPEPEAGRRRPEPGADRRRPEPGATDEGLLAIHADASQARRDREAAFHTLVERYQRRVFAICLRVVGDSGDAEDATQETFVKLARHAGSFRGEAKLSTWLYRVARNAAVDHVRRDARRPATPVDDVATLADGAEPPDLDDPGEALTARETASDLRTALTRLDERSRTMLLLVAVDGLSYSEVAETVDLPVGTVKSRVSRARARLGELLPDGVGEATGAPDPTSYPGLASPRDPPG